MLICAQEYVSAVCLPDADKCQLQCQYTTDVYNRLHQLRDDIERESLVTLTFGDNQTINVCGQQPQVVAALALLEQKTREFLSDDAGGSSCIVGGKGPQGDLSRTSSGASTGAPATKHRWKLESEDSSYDSDYENSETLSPRDAKEEGGSFHDEVSRTVSDTLAAEFAEYVNVRGGKQAGDETWPAGLEEQDEEEATGSGSDFLDAILSDPNYTSRVEFALKLGYTEQQVQIALQKLGPQPGQNELLAELIKLGANSKSLDLQAAGAEDSGSSDDLSGCLDSRIRTDIPEDSYNLRPVVIDGSNVAMSHGNKEIFSCRGIKLCVDWFKSRGHKEITVFVPKWRKEASRPDARITDQEILLELEKERRLVFTPSRLVGGRRLVCYDDRYILKLAVETDGIVVSNDNYRDLANETQEFKKVVEERLLMYSFVNDRFMPPDDPLGRHGPNLENFLRKQPKLPESLPPPCPYGKKCTYGNKCKYYHPERGNLPQKSVTERLVEQAKIQIQEVKARGNKSRDSSPGDSLKQKLTSTVSAPSGMSSETKQVKKTPLSRTRSVIPQSLLPKELTEGSIAHPTRDDNSESSDVQLEGSSSGHETSSKPIDPLISSGQMSGGDTQVPGFLNLPGGPSGFNAQTGIPPSWTSGNQQQSWTPHGLLNTMCNIAPGGHPSGLFYNDPGGHLSVAKRLSDPDSSQNVHNEGTNLHRKLQRQLTLNPSYDPRLYQMHGFVPSPHITDYPNRTMKSEAECRTDTRMHPLPLGVDSHESTIVGGHRPLTRHSSATENRLPASAVPPHLCWLDSSNVGASGEGVHASVTRIASAPDSYRQWPPQHHRGAPMQRLNSTSDTQLNLSSYLGEVYEPESMWNVQTARPAAATHTQWHHDSQKTIPRPHTPLGHMLQPLRPSSVPPHQVTNPNHQTAPSICGEDLRNRLYYHLSSIFPKEQVQAAMRMYPEETNPQKICAAILSMFPPKGH